MQGGMIFGVKMMSVKEEIDIIRRMFDDYVEPVASSFMYGEVPSTVFVIHRQGTKERDWLASVRFKNTTTISMFRCEVWLEDINRLCRRCKIWLQSEDVMEIVALYFMLHPLYQTQHMDFHTNAESDYDSMLYGAGMSTYQFIREHYPIKTKAQEAVLDLLNYHNMVFCNHFGGRQKKTIERYFVVARERYENEMLRNHYMAYKTSIHYKASMSQVDEDGFIRLSPHIDISSIEYVNRDVEQSLREYHEEEENSRYKGKKKFSIRRKNIAVVRIDRRNPVYETEFKHLKASNHFLMEHGKELNQRGDINEKDKD